MTSLFFEFCCICLKLKDEQKKPVRNKFAGSTLSEGRRKFEEAYIDCFMVHKWEQKCSEYRTARSQQKEQRAAQKFS